MRTISVAESLGLCETITCEDWLSQVGVPSDTVATVMGKTLRTRGNGWWSESKLGRFQIGDIPSLVASTAEYHGFVVQFKRGKQKRSVFVPSPHTQVKVTATGRIE